MIRRHRLTLWVLLVWLSIQPALTQTPEHPNGVGARFLFLDHFTPNIADRAESQQLTSGIELSYFRNMGIKYLNVVLPVKFGVARYPDAIRDVRWASADLLLQGVLFDPEKTVSPYLFAGGGLMMENFKESNIQFPFGLGSHVRITRDFYLNVQVEFRKSMAEGRDNLQYGAGFMYVPGLRPKPVPVDTDGDGIPDPEDKCPLLAGPAEWEGCPDSDGDGIPDHRDQCPEEMGPAATFGCPDRDLDGVPDREDRCPDEFGEKELAGCPDRDGDGVPDVDDLCPDEPGSKDNNGCPLPESPGEDTAPAAVIAETPPADRDGDGIPDHLDLCPDVPGLRDLGGCPEPEEPVAAPVEPVKPAEPVQKKETPVQPVKAAPVVESAPVPPPAPVAEPVSGDRDGDGVPDRIDRCPDTPGPASNDGCPVLSAEDRSVLDLAMRSVQFEVGSATITPESFRTLDRIAEIMNRYRDYQLIINGHTDNVGRPTSNLALSEERAKACYNYLISRGIRAERMIHSGFGDARPLTGNRTEEGRGINRRVEFIMYLK
jgi:OmpA-OmpF porin, OOP family